MKNLFLFLALSMNMAIWTSVANAKNTDEIITLEQVDDSGATAEEAQSHDNHHPEPAGWSVIPFVLILIMIATGPLFYAHFWHKNYPIISVLLGALVIGYYVFALHNTHQPIHSMMEYVSFIALISALFVSSGGILIKIDKEGTPLFNVILLIIGAMVANVIGTTGASMLLIRPFIRVNKDRIKPYHIVFFIFMVSNVGGNLTPIGDPPLFLGFLKGVEFFWTLSHLWQHWALGVGLLAVIFFVVDSRNKSENAGGASYSGKFEIVGVKNLIFLAITIGAVFIDPAIMSWVPSLTIDGMQFSFLRELIMFTTAVMAYKLADQEALKGNEFGFEPIKEVGFLFVGIFATMMPALQLVGAFAKANTELVNVNSLYWATGALSGVLDNAPTYLNFLAAGMGKAALDLGLKADVVAYMSSQTLELAAISVAAVFFGAMTYIGNAPNFMVKAIAEQSGVKMPSFVGYVVRYSLPVLLPVLFIIWLVFFAMA